MIFITPQEAREIAKLPSELRGIDSLIRQSAKKGEGGMWIEISTAAYYKLRERGYELTTDQQKYPGKTYIFWGN